MSQDVGRLGDGADEGRDIRCDGTRLLIWSFFAVRGGQSFVFAYLPLFLGGPLRLWSIAALLQLRPRYDERMPGDSAIARGRAQDMWSRYLQVDAEHSTQASFVRAACGARHHTRMMRILPRGLFGPAAPLRGMSLSFARAKFSSCSSDPFMPISLAYPGYPARSLRFGRSASSGFLPLPAIYSSLSVNDPYFNNPVLLFVRAVFPFARSCKFLLYHFVQFEILSVSQAFEELKKKKKKREAANLENIGKANNCWDAGYEGKKKCNYGIQFYSVGVLVGHV
ncbi:hypothetical protein B0H17DRAFT_1149689 [Mycena rosella]|uniref:Uncharacterized protein n=1 Tax=Mycena rosella TaxID=1033263 RepID=A0AAD7FRV0_MYCRO|nr:hypothetical protein B0H17DRAFT_1149689 [Mycena rosella]